MKLLFLTLACVYSLTCSSESYKDLSFEKLLSAAEYNDEVAMAMGFLAENHEHGSGVKKDIQKDQR